eukprot:CAMPEP_0113585832 /NCGR_PEP_ID=MMETSP0015_2-20120614/33942_1 /TAXON_ID=2838 /ORGANISM="Odontella" /LENGTH=634 /DNA_ID=CAMNT_0000491165 /DNA_START=777 /DNA_END=2679 /DNA_ORIENTATION=- /assembly_acc=CAM_ASM_000160
MPSDRGTSFACDRCGLEGFRTYDDAASHESQCGPAYPPPGVGGGMMGGGPMIHGPPPGPMAGMMAMGYPPPHMGGHMMMGTPGGGGEGGGAQQQQQQQGPGDSGSGAGGAGPPPPMGMMGSPLMMGVPMQQQPLGGGGGGPMTTPGKRRRPGSSPPGQVSTAPPGMMGMGGMGMGMPGPFGMPMGMAPMQQQQQQQQRVSSAPAEAGMQSSPLGSSAPPSGAKFHLPRLVLCPEEDLRGTGAGPASRSNTLCLGLSDVDSLACRHIEAFRCAARDISKFRRVYDGLPDEIRNVSGVDGGSCIPEVGDVGVRCVHCAKRYYGSVSGGRQRNSNASDVLDGEPWLWSTSALHGAPAVLFSGTIGAMPDDLRILTERHLVGCPSMDESARTNLTSSLVAEQKSDEKRAAGGGGRGGDKDDRGAWRRAALLDWSIDFCRRAGVSDKTPIGSGLKLSGEDALPQSPPCGLEEGSDQEQGEGMDGGDNLAPTPLMSRKERKAQQQRQQEAAARQKQKQDKNAADVLAAAAAAVAGGSGDAPLRATRQPRVNPGGARPLAAEGAGSSSRDHLLGAGLAPALLRATSAALLVQVAAAWALPLPSRRWATPTSPTSTTGLGVDLQVLLRGPIPLSLSGVGAAG